MRVTDRMNFDQVHLNLQKNRSEMAELQNQAATQKRINKPSDDPVASARVLATRSEDRGIQQFVKNIHQARSFLDYTDQSLSEMSDLLVRAKELAIQQSNDAGASRDTREVAGKEMEQAFAQAVQIGNRKLGDRYIFGGFQTTNPPFNRVADYNGDDGELTIMINKDAQVAMNLPGQRVFLGQGVGRDGSLMPRPELPRSAEEIPSFRNEEQLRHDQIEDLNQGEIQMRSPASVPGRSTREVDAKQTADQDGVNVFQVLKSFEVALKTNDKEEIQTAIDQLDQGINQVVQARAQVGARSQTLSQTQESLQKTLVDNRALQSQLEDADLFQTVSDITKSDSTLRASLETSGRLVQKSLLDFLR